MNSKVECPRNDSINRRIAPRALRFGMILFALVAFGAAAIGAQTKGKPAKPKTPRTVTNF